MVGARGFEPPTLCTQSRCATRLRHAPTMLILHDLLHLLCWPSCDRFQFVLAKRLGERLKEKSSIQEIVRVGQSESVY